MKIKARRAFLISDTHFGARNNSVEWLETMMNYFDNDFIPYVEREYKPGDILIHAGDVFDNRQSVHLSVMCSALNLFERLSKIFVDGIYIIAGNHDVMKKTSNDVSSLDLLKHIPNIHIIKEPIVANVGSKHMLFMPWRTNEKAERECLEQFKGANCDYLICHTNIMHLKFDNSRDVEDGLLLDELQHFKKVYSGHIHWGQQLRNLTMIGNPYQMTRSDMNNKKGFYVLDIESGKDKFVENKTSPVFIKWYLNRLKDKTLNELATMGTNCRIDLYVPSDYILKYNINPIIDTLSKCAKKLDITPFEVDLNINESVEQTDATFNIYDLCEKYIDTMKNVDVPTKAKMVKKIQSLYTNAIQNEN